jgi:hypothetical protein
MTTEDSPTGYPWQGERATINTFATAELSTLPVDSVTISAEGVASAILVEVCGIHLSLRDASMPNTMSMTTLQFKTLIRVAEMLGFGSDQ